VPSLAGTHSGAIDFVDDHASGRLVDGEGPILSVLIDMLSDRERMGAMGRAARAKVLSSGMWDIGLDKFMAAASAQNAREDEQV
jgi:hypothetical protein